MKAKIELIKVEARECDGELNSVWFETEINGQIYGYQIIICNPADLTDSMWDTIGKGLVDTWETWAAKEFDKEVTFE